jgi:pimeloyl-ACP methyl ester carboxylesterase
MAEAKTHTLDVPGAVLCYDVRTAETDSDAPVLLLIASPMDARGFTTLAGYFTDRTVVTYDPRGVSRSERTDGAKQSTPEEHADDLHRLISALDAGPVDFFGSSGGATNGLVLVARHPEQVRTLVAHEPPAATVLPDREQALAAVVDIHETYMRDGLGPAMAKFLTLVAIKGPIPADFPDRPVNPADFGLPTEDDGSRDEPLVGQNIIAGTHYEHDFDALRAASTPDRPRGRSRVRGGVRPPRRGRGRRAAGDRARDLPEPPWRLPRRRVRLARRAGGVRRHPPPGPERDRLTQPAPSAAQPEGEAQRAVPR